VAGLVTNTHRRCGVRTRPASPGRSGRRRQRRRLVDPAAVGSPAPCPGRWHGPSPPRRGGPPCLLPFRCRRRPLRRRDAGPDACRTRTLPTEERCIWTRYFKPAVLGSWHGGCGRPQEDRGICLRAACRV